jgi:hypothetical protein
MKTIQPTERAESSPDKLKRVVLLVSCLNSHFISSMFNNSGFHPNGEIWQHRGSPESKTAYREDPNFPDRDIAGKWWKQWQTLQLFLCCILGGAVGVGHHFYYSYLDGRQAQNQSVS